MITNGPLFKGNTYVDRHKGRGSKGEGRSLKIPVEAEKITSEASHFQ